MRFRWKFDSGEVSRVMGRRSLPARRRGGWETRAWTRASAVAYETYFVPNLLHYDLIENAEEK